MPGTSIFLVEDEALIRMMLADMIEELGHRVVAEAGNVEDGRALAETAIFDLAILDINIAGRSIAGSPRSSTGEVCSLSLSAAMDQYLCQRL
jgi:CheY-like chemotaxis protein